MNPVYLFAAAAVAVPLIAMWTQFTMLGTNAKLDEKVAFYASAALADTKDDKELYELLSRWKMLNGVRACFPALGAIFGVLE